MIFTPLTKMISTNTFPQKILLLNYSVIIFKFYLSSQLECYNRLNETLKIDEYIVHAHYRESCKNQEQNEKQTAYSGDATFSIFTACGYFRFSDSAKTKKVPLTIVSEANGHSRIAAHTCVTKVIRFIEERMPIANSL